jgi:hypothetical protein
MGGEEWVTQRWQWWGDAARQSHWRTVRVFISSTFNDFHGERDVLTRVVFPQLNNICKSRRVSCSVFQFRAHFVLSRVVVVLRGLWLVAVCVSAVCF